jgi:site-specific DNA-methyltransferase (adenine-specific)
MPDTQARIDHILTRQVFGLAITELTGHIARRSVYCSKKADGKFSIASGGAFTRPDGNIRLPKTNHTWDKSGRCVQCGATSAELDRDETREAYAYPLIHGVDPTKEFGVKFDVIVGNPPYQINDGGFGRSASPVYHEFVQQAKRLEPRYLSFVIPARWFAGGKGLDEFRRAMLEDERTRVLVDYLTASDIFSGIGLKGGICYFLWDRDHPGLCRVSTHFGAWPVSTSERRLLEPGADVFIRFNEGVSILRKVIRAETGSTASLALPDEKRFDALVSARKPFGLVTTFRGKPEKAKGDLLVYRNGGTGYAPRKAITASMGAIDKWKIFVGRAGPGTGNRDTYPHKVISTPFVGAPGTVSSETYLYIGPFDSEAQAESALSYLACRLTRFLILLHKPAQGTTRQVYAFVPTQAWTKTWTDEQLYAKYGLSSSEIEFIEKTVRPMDFNENQNDEFFADADDDE